MTRHILLILPVLFFLSCKGDQQSAPAAAPTQTEKTALPPLTMEQLTYLFNNATYVDYIFHKLPFAVSQDSRAGVQANVAMIAVNSPINWKPGCESLGREFFHVDGEIVMEAELYFTEDGSCQAYIFHENGKPAYANAVSDAGINFYNNLLKQPLPNGQ